MYTGLATGWFFIGHSSCSLHEAWYWPKLVPRSLAGDGIDNLEGCGNNTRVSVCVSLPLVWKGNWIQRLTIRDPEKISVCMCGFSTGATSRMATSQFAVWVAAFCLFLMLQTCWTQQGYAFYAIIFSYGVDTACFEYVECVIDKSVNCSPTQVACHCNIRRVPEVGGEGVAGTVSVPMQ